MEEIVFGAFMRALPIFFDREVRNILDDVSERNLCGLLQHYIRLQLDGTTLANYHVDTEYNRKQQGEVKAIIDENEVIIPISCDLLVHSRGEQIEHDNLLALEMKKYNRPQTQKLTDKKRLRALTMPLYDGVWGWNGTHPEHVCGYKVGIYMEINRNNRSCYFERYGQGKIHSSWTEIF